MCITTGLLILIQSCNSSIETAGPAGASDKTFGHVDANLDECVNVSLRLTEISKENNAHGSPFDAVAVT
jgi:hypothetical protein